MHQIHNIAGDVDVKLSRKAAYIYDIHTAAVEIHRVRKCILFTELVCTYNLCNEISLRINA
jgi:hypothetical protein